jgi:leader peptidase (prepilin peptidase) / N-methyltransferase
MSLAWSAVGTTAGLPLGAAVRGTVFRLSVPGGAPDRTACPRCAAPVPARAAIQCQYCRASFGTPAVFEVATAAVLGLLVGQFGGRLEALAFGYLGVLGVALAAIDISVQRLPDRLVLPALPALILLLAVAAAAGHQEGALIRALLGSLALAAGFLLLALARPGQLGGGDVKLASLVGLMLGWLGWPALLIGTAAGFMLSAVVSLVLLAARRVTLRDTVSFGPFLLCGTLLAIVITGR